MKNITKKPENDITRYYKTNTLSLKFKLLKSITILIIIQRHKNEIVFQIMKVIRRDKITSLSIVYNNV